MASESLSLKWGSLKAWSLNNKRTLELLRKWHDLGVCASAMAHTDTPEQKEIVCQIIDAVDCETIYLDWDGKHVSKEEAKEYVLNYGLPDAIPPIHLRT
jgi:hypothetical protein